MCGNGIGGEARGSDPKFFRSTGGRNEDYSGSDCSPAGRSHASADGLQRQNEILAPSRNDRGACRRNA
jgi:hypothetical protein